jgi:hypothetical protein
MDRIPSPLELNHLAITLRYGQPIDRFGILAFNLGNESTPISSVDLIEFSRLMRSAIYAGILYGICGSSYVPETDISLGFFDFANNAAVFKILEGSATIFEKRVDLVNACREIGEISLWVVSYCCAGERKSEIERPPLYFDSSQLWLDK